MTWCTSLSSCGLFYDIQIMFFPAVICETLFLVENFTIVLTSNSKLLKALLIIFWCSVTFFPCPAFLNFWNISSFKVLKLSQHQVASSSELFWSFFDVRLFFSSRHFCDAKHSTSGWGMSWNLRFRNSMDICASWYDLELCRSTS